MSAPRPAWSDDLDVLDRIERALTHAQLEGLHQALDALALDRDTWTNDRSLARVFGGFAAANLREKWLGAGLSEDRALAEVSLGLGIPKPTVRSWLYRWRD